MTIPYFGRNLYEVVNDIKGRPFHIPEVTDRETIDLLQGILAVNLKMRSGIEDFLRNRRLNYDQWYKFSSLWCVGKVKCVKRDSVFQVCRWHAIGGSHREVLEWCRK
jgi:hypothetical protein